MPSSLTGLCSRVSVISLERSPLISQSDCTPCSSHLNPALILLMALRYSISVHMLSLPLKSKFNGARSLVSFTATSLAPRSFYDIVGIFKFVEWINEFTFPWRTAVKGAHASSVRSPEDLASIILFLATAKLTSTGKICCPVKAMGSTTQNAGTDPFLSIKCLPIGIFIQLILCSEDWDQPLLNCQCCSTTTLIC